MSARTNTDETFQNRRGHWKTILVLSPLKCSLPVHNWNFPKSLEMSWICRNWKNFAQRSANFFLTDPNLYAPSIRLVYIKRNTHISTKIALLANFQHKINSSKVVCDGIINDLFWCFRLNANEGMHETVTKTHTMSARREQKNLLNQEIK